ncbi:hypothetical protein RT723_04630 [Psychrosphaera aquimarina]|uniref:Uncharacterized protein n=1 Tax=Psychrosphaera aquimarina TaxID=2044854 RepID=A0ABU3QXZ5_9GAMM|nr:hypothetical protein [Psychrosphaera aquimarina]MDU0112294.1 hypothetical protein [Psychrosphaera aquimarina]
MNTREKLLTCVKKFEESNIPISISKVAGEVGISHSHISNNHPDIRDDIIRIKKEQKIQILIEKKNNKTEKLIKHNETLARKLSLAKDKQADKTIATLMAHIQELYSMYDSLLEERNSFAERILDYEK